MGAGNHGGFGNTYGSRAISLSPTYAGKDNDLKTASKWVKPKDGYTDIIIHGRSDRAEIKVGDNKWVKIDHRVLARMYKGDKDYSKKPIRLISCKTGKDVNGFAQNLANKTGRKVIAPSDTVWIHPSGKLTIGPNARTDSGKWVPFYPGKRGK